MVFLPSGFNPRPAFFCGATRGFSSRISSDSVSIRAPRSSAGRLQFDGCTHSITPFQSAPRVLLRGDHLPPHSSASYFCFNPRPAFFCGATLCGYPFARIHPEFQSAPRVLLRGDVAFRPPGDLPNSFNPRPAFFCGATHWNSGAHRRDGVSIRAPRSSAGRRTAGRIVDLANNVSIRAPRSSAGRRYGFSFYRTSRWVSIRAPRSSAGRPK